jgi:DNA-binding GntR family transcriptional regulator
MSPARSGDGSSPATLVEHAAQDVRERILSGALAPDERILLDAIADDLGMSPIPVREALRTLATEGLVARLPRRGYKVAPVTLADLDETYRVRLLLEPLAVSLAVPTLTAADLKTLHRELELLGEAFTALDWEAHRTHHRAFHFGLYDRCGSAWLIRFADMLWLNSERYQRMTTEIRGELTERMTEHERVAARLPGRPPGGGLRDRRRAVVAGRRSRLTPTRQGRRKFLDSLAAEC